MTAQETERVVKASEEFHKQHVAGTLKIGNKRPASLASGSCLRTNFNTKPVVLGFVEWTRDYGVEMLVEKFYPAPFAHFKLTYRDENFEAFDPSTATEDERGAAAAWKAKMEQSKVASSPVMMGEKRGRKPSPAAVPQPEAGQSTILEIAALGRS